MEILRHIVSSMYMIVAHTITREATIREKKEMIQKPNFDTYFQTSVISSLIWVFLVFANIQRYTHIVMSFTFLLTSLSCRYLKRKRAAWDPSSLTILWIKIRRITHKTNFRWTNVLRIKNLQLLRINSGTSSGGWTWVELSYGDDEDTLSIILLVFWLNFIWGGDSYSMFLLYNWICFCLSESWITYVKLWIYKDWNMKVELLKHR